MNDDDLLAPLRAPLPEPDALFWARMQRDVRASIARRWRVVHLGSLAVAAALVLGVFVVHSHHHPAGPMSNDVFDPPDDPEASVGVAVEELSDDEIARAMKNFPQGG